MPPPPPLWRQRAQNARALLKKRSQTVLNELIARDSAPMPIAWACFEELVRDVRRFGAPVPWLRRWLRGPPVSAAARKRCERVVDANNHSQAEANHSARAPRAAHAQTGFLVDLPPLARRNPPVLPSPYNSHGR